ncbi:hypothetical protein GCM10009532_08830 [Microbacterium aurantiacum]
MGDLEIVDRVPDVFVVQGAQGNIGSVTGARRVTPGAAALWSQLIRRCLRPMCLVLREAQADGSYEGLLRR